MVRRQPQPRRKRRGGGACLEDSRPSSSHALRCGTPALYKDSPPYPDKKTPISPHFYSRPAVVRPRRHRKSRHFA
eukprot:scaffold13776_cov85-Isochrysis_galbana.AAC.2